MEMDKYFILKIWQIFQLSLSLEKFKNTSYKNILAEQNIKSLENNLFKCKKNTLWADKTSIDKSLIFLFSNTLLKIDKKENKSKTALFSIGQNRGWVGLDKL